MYSIQKIILIKDIKVLNDKIIINFDLKLKEIFLNDVKFKNIFAKGFFEIKNDSNEIVFKGFSTNIPDRFLD